MKKILIIMMVIFVILVSVFVGQLLLSKNDNCLSKEESLNLENLGEEKKVSVNFYEEGSISYLNENNEQQSFTVNGISFDFDSNYIKLINESYKEKVSYALENFNLLTSEETSIYNDEHENETFFENQIESSISYYYKYDEYQNVGSLAALEIYSNIYYNQLKREVLNINLETGTKYSNIELLNLFNIDTNELLEKTNNLFPMDVLLNIDNLELFINNDKLYIVLRESYAMSFIFNVNEFLNGTAEYVSFEDLK